MTDCATTSFRPPVNRYSYLLGSIPSDWEVVRKTSRGGTFVRFEQPTTSVLRPRNVASTTRRRTSRCTCDGTHTFAANQYCHSTNSPKCLDVCAASDVVSDTSCRCVPSSGGGDEVICIDGQTCNIDATCAATVADCTNNVF